MKTLKKILLILIIAAVCLTTVTAKDRPTVAVILSGGGAKGIAHIALLEKLEELGIPVDMVMGTSMGSLIGGLYSAGYSPNDILNLIKENNLASLFDVLESKGYKSLMEPFEYKSESLTIGLGDGILTVSGILDDYKIMNFFYDAIGNIPDSIDFDDLPIAFRCIGTNAITGESKVFEDGSLIDAMRASMSIPFAFSPKEIDGSLYVDGGLVDNMPVELAKNMGYDIIIAEDVNAKFEVTTDQYASISGTAGALFRVIVNTTINHQKQYADIILEPDLRGYGVFSFDVPEELIERGATEVANRADELAEIANRFTEDQKEYKDPNRKGEYFTRFAEREKKEVTSLASRSSEKALKQTRVTSKIKISSNLRHDFIDEYPYEFLISPVFENKLYLKDIKGTKFSLNLKVGIGYPTSIDTYLLYQLIEKQNSLFAVLGSDITVGSISHATDKNSYLSTVTSKNIEVLAEQSFGFMLTDELNHNINLHAVAGSYITKSIVVYGDYVSKDFGHLFYTFYPHLTASYVWYGNPKNSTFNLEGTRFDFLTNVGFIDKTLVYKIGCAFEFEVPVSKKSGIWFDAAAFTTREPDEFSDSYIGYGGFDGMPGYSYSEKFRDYVYGGIGYQIMLKEGLLSEYLQLEVRAGYREKDSAYTDYCLYDRNPVPFSYMKNNGKFDLGFGIGLGFQSFLGEALIGVGITKDLNCSLYFNVM